MKKGFTIIELMIIIAIIGIIAAMLGSDFFVEEEDAKRHLETEGYSNIQVVDHTWVVGGFRGCSDSDMIKYRVRAINPVGKPVMVNVCTGLFFKGATTRTE